MDGASVKPDWSRAPLFREKSRNGKCIVQGFFSARRKESTAIKAFCCSDNFHSQLNLQRNWGHWPCPGPEFQPRIRSEVWCQQWPFLRGFCGRCDCTKTEQKKSRHTNTLLLLWQKSHRLTWHRFCKWWVHPRPRCCQRPSYFESPHSSLCFRSRSSRHSSYSF